MDSLARYLWTPRYSVVLPIAVAVPYTDDPGESKIRPTVIISPNQYNRASGHVIVLPITSNMGARQEGDVSIVGAHIEESGLKHPSIIKVGYPVTVSADRVIRVLGTLPASLYDDAWAGFLRVMGIE